MSNNPTKRLDRIRRRAKVGGKRTTYKERLNLALAPDRYTARLQQLRLESVLREIEQEMEESRAKE